MIKIEHHRGITFRAIVFQQDEDTDVWFVKDILEAEGSRLGSFVQRVHGKYTGLEIEAVGWSFHLGRTKTTKSQIDRIVNQGPTKFSGPLQDALNELSRDIAADMPHDSDAEEIAEVCMDASRLTIAGHPDLDAEVSRFNKRFGYDALLKEGAKYVSTW